MAAAVAFALTPLVRRLVLRHDVVDRPDAAPGQRRARSRAAGGIAVAAAFLSVAVAFVVLNGMAEWVPVPLTAHGHDLIALFVGGGAGGGHRRRRRPPRPARALAARRTGRARGRSRSRSGVVIEFIANPFGAGRSSGSTAPFAVGFIDLLDRRA